MSKRSPARIPYIPLFGKIAQFQLNTPPVSVLYHPKAVLWARYSAGHLRTAFPLCSTVRPLLRTVFTLFVTKHGLHVRSHVVKPCWIHAPLSSLVVGTYQDRVSETVIANRRNLSDIVNKGLPKGVLSKHLRLVWLIERFAWIKGTVLQYRATVLPNVGIARVLGIIFVRVIKRILPRNRGGWVG